MPFIYVDVHLKTILAVTFSFILLRVCQRLVCQKMEFAARLSPVKFKDPMFMKFSLE